MVNLNPSGGSSGSDDGDDEQSRVERGAREARQREPEPAPSGPGEQIDKDVRDSDPTRDPSRVERGAREAVDAEPAPAPDGEPVERPVEEAKPVEEPAAEASRVEQAAGRARVREPEAAAAVTSTEARVAAEEVVGPKLQEGLEGRGGTDPRVQQQARDLEQRAVEESAAIDDPDDVAIRRKGDELVAMPSRSRQVESVEAQLTDFQEEVTTRDPDRLFAGTERVPVGVDVDPDDVELEPIDGGVVASFNEKTQREIARQRAAREFEDFGPNDIVVESGDDGVTARPSEDAVRSNVQEEVAGGVDAIDPDDVVLKGEGDELGVDFEATAEEAAGESDPGLLARGISTAASRTRHSAAGAAIPLLATSLRSEDGIEVPVGGGRTISLPGGEDVDDAVEALEPADEAFKGGVERATDPAEFASGQIDEETDLGPVDVAPAGLGAQAVASPAAREGAIEGVERGVGALSPAAVAQDAIRIGDLGVRGTERASREGSAEEIQGGLDLGTALGEEAVDRAPEAARRTTIQDPSKAVEIPAAIATAGLAGAAIGTGAAAAPRAARASGRTVRRGAGRVRREATRLRDDDRGMAPGKRTITKTKEAEETVEIDESEAERLARELDVDDFDSADELAREQALLAERDRMPPRDAFPSEEEFLTTLNQRAARRLEIDEEDFLQSRQADESVEEPVATVTQREAEAFAPPGMSTTTGVAAFAARETQREAEDLAFATPSLEEEIGSFEALDQPTALREGLGERTIETQGLMDGLTTEQTLTEDLEATAEQTRLRQRVGHQQQTRRTRRIDLPDLGGGNSGRRRRFGFFEKEIVAPIAENPLEAIDEDLGGFDLDLEF